MNITELTNTSSSPSNPLSAYFAHIPADHGMSSDVASSWNVELMERTVQKWDITPLSTRILRMETFIFIQMINLHIAVRDKTVNKQTLNQSKLNQSKLNQSKLNQSKLNQSKLNQSKLNQSKLNQSKLNQSKLNQSIEPVNKMLPTNRPSTVNQTRRNRLLINNAVDLISPQCIVTCT